MKSKKKMTALICGSIAYDIIMEFKDRFKNHILPDQTHILNIAFLVSGMRREFGGCAGNIAYNLKLLGAEPIPMATVGKDFKIYAEWLDQCQINREFITVIDPEFTAQAFITTDLDNNQITIFHPGAMNYAHQNTIFDTNGGSIGIVSPDGREGMQKHTQEFADSGIPFIFDPGQQLSLFNRDELIEMLDRSQWVVMNDYEWKLFHQQSRLEISDILSYVQALIVTHGGNGSTIYTDDNEIVIPPAHPDNVVDPTGCGDAYRAGLLYGLMQDLDWETTGRIASMMGAIKIAMHGTQNHRFKRSDFDARFYEYFGRNI